MLHETQGTFGGILLKELRTEIEINAPPTQVWEILMDFEGMPEWNPFIRNIQGDKIVDGKLKVDLRSPSGKVMTFKPKVKAFNPPKEFRWLGRLGIPGLFDGEHSFLIEPLAENRVRFVHKERFKGILVPLLWKSLDTGTRKNFQEMNEALRIKAEGK